MRKLLQSRLRERYSFREWLLLAVLIVAISALVLLFLGRTLFCECGVISAWHGTIDSDQTSQQFTDWYTLSHFIYGFIFYALTWVVAKKLPLGLRLCIAVLLESAWEIIENTDPIINQFRGVNIWRGYYGDSILNSMGDILAMAFGFLLAYRFPVWISIIGIVALDILAAFIIRDSLVIGTVMFFHEVEFIAHWQAGG